MKVIALPEPGILVDFEIPHKYLRSLRKERLTKVA
jgi:hypothetical protein